MRKKVTKSQPDSASARVVAGIAVEIVVTILGAVIATVFLARESIEMATMKFLAHGIQFVSVLLGGIVTGLNVKEKSVILMGISTITYSFILVVIAILMMDSTFTSFGTSMLAILLAYVISCAFCITRRGNWRGRKHVHG